MLPEDADLVRLERLLWKTLMPRTAQEVPALGELTGEVREAVEVLIERGSMLQKTLAVLVQAEERRAWEMIEALKRSVEKTIGEEEGDGKEARKAFDMRMLEGHFWYQSGEFVAAAEQYEKAMALQPEDVDARNSVAIAYQQMWEIITEEQQWRVLEILEGTLPLVKEGSVAWAEIKCHLALAWWMLEEGDTENHSLKAMALYEAALQVYKVEDHPREWAQTQMNIGYLWLGVPTGDAVADVSRGIEAMGAAMRVSGETSHAKAWAQAQNRLGQILAETMTVENRKEHLRKAIMAHEAALKVFTRETDPVTWALVQCDLGRAWFAQKAGDRGKNVWQAIGAFERALEVLTEEEHPREWRWAQNALATVWAKVATGDRTANLRKAIVGFEETLRGALREDDPIGWATAQNNLGQAWSELPTGNREENQAKAYAAFEAALEVFASEGCREEWAKTQLNIGIALHKMPGGDQAERVKKVLAAYEAALEVYTRKDFPESWASVQINKGVMLSETWAPTWIEDMQKAVACFEGAIEVMRRETHPLEWARAHLSLGNVLQKLPADDWEARIQRVLQEYEAVLEVYTPESRPVDWARVQNNMAAACKVMTMRVTTQEGRLRWSQQGIRHCKSALSVFTAEAFPADHKRADLIIGWLRWAYREAGGKDFAAIREME